MSYYYENKILVNCNECITNILKYVRELNPFAIKDDLGDNQDNRKKLLESIISTLYYSSDFAKAPNSSREKITESLLNHGQFNKDEIDEIFEDYSIHSADYSNEFFENHPDIDIMELIKIDISNLGLSSDESDESNFFTEKQYNFPSSGCDYKYMLGLCPQDIEKLECPDCGNLITNTPENVTWSCTHDLICPSCKKEDEFDIKGIIRRGYPKHHGRWATQQPEFIYEGTDYFHILHPKCRKSNRSDGKGVMLVNGIWSDSSNNSQDRIVLSLECTQCGIRNAIKPSMFKDRPVPLLDVNKERVIKLIEKGEYEKLEFKPYLTEPPSGYVQSGNNKYKIIKSIAGFINSEGGTLLIGVADSGRILGIGHECSEQDPNLNRDDYRLKLNHILSKHFDEHTVKTFLNISFHEICGEDICCIQVQKSDKPICLQNGDFFVRIFAHTRNLKDAKRANYTKKHWGNIDE